MNIGKFRLTLEHFPVANAERLEKLLQVRQELSVLPWELVSVTYGAGGTTRERTLNTVKELLKEKIDVMPHLTCVSSTQEEITALLDTYQRLGIKHLMALRGDIPSGMFDLGDMMTSIDLVYLVRQKWDDTAKIFVAAYPEGHPRSRTPEKDLEFFCAKVKAGANAAVTQYFYNADAFLRFRDEVRAKGVDIPLVVGVMPITNYIQLARFSDSCGAEIPRWIRKRLEALRDDLPSLQEFGADVVASMIQRLEKEDATALHFYSMNRSDAILKIANRLNWLD